MGILRKPFEEAAHAILSGTPAVANGLLTIAGYPPIHSKDVLRVHNLVSATAGTAQVTTVAEIAGVTNPSSIYSVSIGGLQEGAMSVRTQTASIRQDAANSISVGDLNAALVRAINAKFGRFLIADLTTNVGFITLTARVNGPSFSVQSYTDDTTATFGTVAVSATPAYPVGQLANRVNASQPKQLRDLFPHLTESTPAIITTALDKIDVEVYDRNFNGGDGSGRKKVISFYGSTARVTAIQNALDYTGTSQVPQMPQVN